MANITINGETALVEDGSGLIEVGRELGVPFACASGICCSCQVKVTEGMNNLTPMTENEEEMDFEPGERLLCQCKLNKGSVRMEFE